MKETKDLRDRVEEEIKNLIEPEAWERCETCQEAEQESLQTVFDARGGAAMKRGKRRRVARFVSLHHRLLKSHAWHCLTPLQRCGYIEIAQLYDGTNNGRLAMSTRRLAGLIPCSKNSLRYSAS